MLGFTSFLLHLVHATRSLGMSSLLASWTTISGVTSASSGRTCSPS
jgi:hypothetical protein